MRIILPLFAVVLSLTMMAEPAIAQCEHCESDTGGHYFIPPDQDPYYDCNGECHTSTEWGSCDLRHDPCFAEQDAQDLAAAIERGDGTRIDDLVTKMSSQLVFVPSRELVVVRGCHDEYVAGFSVGSSPRLRRAIELASEEIPLVQ